MRTYTCARALARSDHTRTLPLLAVLRREVERNARVMQITIVLARGFETRGIERGAQDRFFVAGVAHHIA